MSRKPATLSEQLRFAAYIGKHPEIEERLIRKGYAEQVRKLRNKFAWVLWLTVTVLITIGILYR